MDYQMGNHNGLQATVRNTYKSQCTAYIGESMRPDILGIANRNSWRPLHKGQQHIEYSRAYTEQRTIKVLSENTNCHKST